MTPRRLVPPLRSAICRAVSTLAQARDGDVDDGLVALSTNKRAAVRAGVRDLLVRLCAILGSIAGLLWALDHQAGGSGPCENAAADEVSRCAGETIIATALPYAAGLFGGLLIGALVGLAAAQLVVPRRARAAVRPGSGRSNPRALAPGRWIIARYRGSCATCGSAIAAGDRVFHRPRRTMCAPCAPDAPVSGV